MAVSADLMNIDRYGAKMINAHRVMRIPTEELVYKYYKMKQQSVLKMDELLLIARQYRRVTTFANCCARMMCPSFASLWRGACAVR